MPRAFSDDLRSRVLAAPRDGMSARSAAALWDWRFNSHRLDCQRTGGAVDACKTGSTHWLDAYDDFIIGMIEEEKGHHAQRDGSSIA